MFLGSLYRGPASRRFTSVARQRPVFSQITKMSPTRANSSATSAAGYKEDHSKGAMLRFQESLPRLPVPSLQETADRYVKSVHPLLSEKEFHNTQAAVAEFIKSGGAGEQLQKKLVARASNPNTKNWLHEWWNDAAYLGYRDPVVPYVSYFYSFKDDKKRRDPAKRAAAITTATLSFKKEVDEGSLEPEYMRKQPLCMDSYQWMFNACRVPEKPSDYPVKYPADLYKHIVVVRKNQFFKVMHEVNGQQLTTGELEAQFKRVYELANASKTNAVGALTSDNRDYWTDARETLLLVPENAKALEIIQSASFVICLDDTAPVTLEERAHQYWHGDGQNRFYDKPLQFIINENGTAGFMGEHSMMDGTPTLRLCDYVNMVIAKQKVDLNGDLIRSDLPEPTPINFEISKEAAEAIDASQKRFRETISAHDLRVVSYQGYGKELIKKFKCSPDAYVQMIIQLAYYKMYGKNRPTYESAATRKFQLGRTETCRSVSDDSVAWCKAMDNPQADTKTCIALFRKALASHIKYIGDASEGKGVDRHLFGLKKLLAPGQELPSIYKDPAYSYSSSWFLSTSQLNSEYFNGYGWSQVIDQGFGIAYMVNENSLNFNVASKKLGADKMGFWLQEAAGDIRDMMMTELEEPKAKL